MIHFHDTEFPSEVLSKMTTILTNYTTSKHKHSFHLKSNILQVSTPPQLLHPSSAQPATPTHLTPSPKPSNRNTPPTPSPPPSKTPTWKSSSTTNHLPKQLQLPNPNPSSSAGKSPRKSASTRFASNLHNYLS